MCICVCVFICVLVRRVLLVGINYFIFPINQTSNGVQGFAVTQTWKLWIWLGGQAAAGEGTQRLGTKQHMLYGGKTLGNVTGSKLEGKKKIFLFLSHSVLQVVLMSTCHKLESPE